MIICLGQESYHTVGSAIFSIQSEHSSLAGGHRGRSSSCGHHLPRDPGGPQRL